ncbi:MAG: hypothetical protein OCD76_24770 [Reichenbachiella sp.]
MSKEVKVKAVKAVKTISYESLKALYFSGKVKPSLNKILSELENSPENLDLRLLACQCLVRTKDFVQLSSFADIAIELEPENAGGYYYKGLALHHSKGKEQEALKNFNQALTIDPENTVYLKGKATTHLELFTDYHLPITLAEKHRAKGEESLMKIISLVEAKENATFIDFMNVGDVSITINRNLDAKKYYIKAVNAFEKAEEVDQNRNLYKDIVKAQKACNRLIEKFTE